MPRAGQVRIEPGQRLSDRVALGVLTATFSRQLVDEVIEATGRREKRNRLLPAQLTVYYVLAMTLFSSAGYEEVMRSLTEGLTWASDGEDEYEMASQVAISQARARLGPEPLGRAVCPGLCAAGNACDPRRVLPRLASGELRRHDDRCRRHPGQRGGIWSRRDRPR